MWVVAPGKQEAADAEAVEADRVFASRMRKATANLAALAAYTCPWVVSLEDFEGPVARFRGVCGKGKFASWEAVDAHRGEHVRHTQGHRRCIRPGLLL